MATIAELLGVNPDSLAATATAALAATTQHAQPDDYPQLAHLAHRLDTDLRTAYHDELTRTEHHERQQDRQFLERASEFVELNDQVDQSTHLLSELASFLSTFQRDLSAVSGHISELQGRSKTIEARLKARKAIERSLHPFLRSITLSPTLIRTLLDTDPASNTAGWITAVRELDAKLGAIRGGARVESRRSLDEAAEGLRVAASSKILSHLISLLRPYTLSLTPSLPALHASLLSLKPLFDFLRRHAARQAHEFQKAYQATVRWYYETGFRRYVRGLEKIRTRAPGTAPELIGSTSGGGDSLALLNQRRLAPSTPSLSSSPSTPNLSAVGAAPVTPATAAAQSALDNSQNEGPGVILAHLQNDRNFKPPPEALFRSLSLVLSDNATSEYAFLAAFFGTHSSLDLPSSAPLASASAKEKERGRAVGKEEGLEGRTTRGTSDSSLPRGAGVVPLDGLGMTGAPVGAPSESGKTVVSATGRERERAREREKEREVQRVVVEGLWKGVMEPALEYARNFVHALLDPISPSTLSLLSMIHLNDALLTTLTSSPSSSSPTAYPPTPTPDAPSPAPPPSAEDAPCPPLAQHLTALRLLLLPTFSKLASAHVDSLRKINGSTGASGALGGMFGGSGGSVKDSVVEAVVRRYAELFGAVVAIREAGAADGGEGEGEAAGATAGSQTDEMVFSSLLRIRGEVDKLIAHQASKISDPAKQKAFLRAHYAELLQGLSAGLSRHPRSQSEVAHYRELARRAA
ncbi:hypothetical protein JCM8097_001278 [Rhodosporidiobolus ruineniae]